MQLKPQHRILSAGLVSLIFNTAYLIYISHFFPTFTDEFGRIILNVLTIHVAGTMIVTSLLEKSNDNMKTREGYMESERLKIVSALSASVSHEIRNPLTVTNGFLQLLKQSQSLPVEEKKYVEYSLQELNRAEGIVRDFLSLAKPQAENMIVSNLKAEFEYVTNVMKPFAHINRVDIQLHFNNTLLKQFDRNQLQQCLINLYKNGIEAMKDVGGTLSIKVYGHNNKITITISDTGTGMTKEEISRVGKPYYSTKEEGTGLGMMYVYSTINQLKGTIQVESEKGKGTTFYIELPTS